MAANKVAANEFAEFLQTIVKLDALTQITQDLDKELADSQRVMKDIKSMFDAIPNAPNRPEANNGLRHDDISKFLESGPPKLLLPDMAENTIDVDLDDVIATMKVYAEDLKRNMALAQPPPTLNKNIESVDLQQYATSLDQLSKRLANIKLGKGDESHHRSPEVEAKLAQLCQDVNMFSQMVQAKTTLSECNQNWTSTAQETDALCYDNIINKLLSGINEVTYLLRNKN
ncbi:uncharacterized protein LOC115448382 [Manduca sexta]|uniref:uncharacterized protein LOC115448382 n=1 Tax=Manduca sexta TaxID=7130 RepID=UPI00188F3F76|nr:uncharacterized protein LOC115448382 [Manduca sexta]